MQRYIVALAAGMVLCTLPTQGRAQLQAGPYLAYHDDMHMGMGVFVGFPATSIDENLFYRVDLGFFFPGNERFGRDQDYAELNGNLLYRFPLPEASFTPWALGGLNIARYTGPRRPNDPDLSDRTDTEIGLNVGAGVTFGSGPTQPFVGVKFELGGGEGGVIFGGVSFLVGQGIGS